MTTGSLHRVSVESVDCEVPAIRSPQFIDAKRACHGHGPDGESSRLSGHHPDNNTVVERGPRPEAAFLIIANQHKLCQAGLLETRQQVAADPYPGALQGGHLLWQEVAGEGIPLLHGQLNVIK